MKIANIMNFARGYNSIEKQFAHTAREFELVNEMGLENTFLLQYDAVCCELYQNLFKEKATDKTEIGLWYEIVEPLTTACNMPYRTELGRKWDYHIIPGFSARSVGNLTIKNCLFKDSGASNGHLFVENVNTLNLINNTFEGSFEAVKIGANVGTVNKQ